MADVRVPTGMLARLVRQAEIAGLDDPLGRAVYAMNRRSNAGPRYLRVATPTTEHEASVPWQTATAWIRAGDLDVMSRAKPDTAERWRLHWLNGGHVKSLGRKASPRTIVTRYEPDTSMCVRRRAIALGGLQC